MSKFKMLTGPFEGEVVEEGHNFISHLGFHNLDDDMKLRVRQFGEDKYFAGLPKNDTDLPVPLNDLVQEYENSWESLKI